MRSTAPNVAAYLESLPADRCAAIAVVRQVILANLDEGYEEGMQYGMIGYCVPHRLFPAGYHADPKAALPYAGLASQKGHMSLYLMSVYCGCEGGEETPDARWFREAWKKSGKKLDMGKSCIRFKKLEDVPLEVVGEAIRRVPVTRYVAMYQKSLAAMARHRAAAKGARTPARKPAGTKRAAPSRKVAGKAAPKKAKARRG